MDRLYNTLFGLIFAFLCSMPVWAADKEQVTSPATPQRELIYCADYMTHEEREAYRARMRAARTPEDKAMVRQAHQSEMQARLRKQGIDPGVCEPRRYRQRLRHRGG